MKKQRYILCLLLSGMLLYYAMPRLDIYSGGAEGFFSITWLVLALIVIAGNLTALLYAPKQAGKTRRRRSNTQKKKVRSYQ
ncbi:hypothetical protein [Cytobacillus purgationiresistens]|uniref:Uncharacterized protein n=1 Tax=Cytobacillus purgationiresistens TaxID=863449 RepID=A0ABU0ALD2_9BACI|nr:hypothetical protein [Cytobacillus purgationiresistens]MDQ0272079.1 hypothetical protein [Cytobacillus purgationiresistens]